MKADLNVFELTNMELHKTEAKKSVKESVSKTSKKATKKAFNIPVNKLKFESLSHYLSEDADEEETELDVTADYTPDDDVVLVIDPEMDEVPEDVEEAEEQAEDIIGDHICKCAICGANYITDAEISEELEMEEETCPVCGETGEQIVVGVITPTEELSAEDEEDIEGTEDIDIEDEEEIETADGEEEEFDEFEEEDDFEESVKRSRARTLRRKAESVRKIAKRPTSRKLKESKSIDFDEATFNRMLTRFAKENYENVRFVRISEGTVRGNKLTLSGIVTTTKGSKKSIKFVAENFIPAKRMTIKFKESGAFTESVKNPGFTFVVECVMKGSVIVPAALSYNFKAKNEGLKDRGIYSVTGKVLSESVRRPAPKKRFKK
ncbi:MAG: hypothetical protein J6V44_15415 [Methanobrevibacter sp.]|nr:hypothetical protein [Methanobrevibacter sp.]